MENEVLERANDTLNNVLEENEKLKHDLEQLRTQTIQATNRAEVYRNALIALAKEIS